jgi:predicted amidohydrolase
LLGTLSPGAAADATLFQVEPPDRELTDSVGQSIVPAARIAVRGVVMSGRYAEVS